MNRWIVVEFDGEGKATILEGEYTTWEDACKVQEEMETMHYEKAYLIYTCDEWMYECENGRM